MKTLRTVVRATPVAAVVGLATLVAACAGPNQVTRGRTVEQADMAKFERALHRGDCRLVVHGKYTEHHCEYK